MRARTCVSVIVCVATPLSKPKPPTNAQPPQQQDKLALKEAKWGGGGTGTQR